MVQEIMIYFTADLHLGHRSIIQYCKRPFSSLEEMDNTLIDNWNKVVNNSDAVYLLGDFAWKDHESYAKRLKGNIYFIRGNHDYRSDTFYLTKCKFRSVTKRSEISIRDKHLVLDHYCLRTWNRSHYNSYHCFAHSHGGLTPIGKSWDVGVDNNSYSPISYEELSDILEKAPDNFNYISPEERNVRKCNKKT